MGSLVQTPPRGSRVYFSLLQGGPLSAYRRPLVSAPLLGDSTGRLEGLPVSRPRKQLCGWMGAERAIWEE